MGDKECRKDKEESVEEGKVCGKHVVNSAGLAVGIGFQLVDGKSGGERANVREGAHVEARNSLWLNRNRVSSQTAALNASFQLPSDVWYHMASVAR